MDWDVNGVNLSYDAAGEHGEITVIYDYYAYGSLTRRRGRVGLDWEVVPENRAAPIEWSSTDICLPGKVANEDLYINVSTFAYTGKVEMKVEGGDHVRWETSDIPPHATYTAVCSWPPEIMQEEEGGGETALPQSPLCLKSWDFERFDVEIEVRPDASLLIRETQLINFRGSFSFLNRDLTFRRAKGVSGKSYGKVRFSDFAVYDLEGNPLDRDSWRVENTSDGKCIHVEFSARDERKGFVFVYRMKGAVLYFHRYDRLYYNAVSEVREVPIASFATEVRFPAGTDLDQVETELYVGRYSRNAPFRWDRGWQGEVFGSRSKTSSRSPPMRSTCVFPKGWSASPGSFGSPPLRLAESSPFSSS